MTAVNGYGHEPNFLGYCRGVARGTSLAATMAKLVLRIGCKTPEGARLMLQRQRGAGEVTAEEYALRLEAVDLLAQMRRRGVVQYRADTSDTSDWFSLPGGGHVRRTHQGEGY